MIENRDGSFGEIKPVKDLLQEVLEKENSLDSIKAIHIGTEGELIRKKLEEVQKANLEYRVEELEKKLNWILVKLGYDKESILVVDKL